MVKGWKKVDEYVWRKDSPSFGKSGSLYEFVWVDNHNNIRIADAMPKNSSPLDLVNESYVYSQHKSLADARKNVMNFMRSHLNG